MAELNPQLKNSLKILAVSPAFVPGIICMRAATLEALRDLHAEPGGQQLLRMFKVDERVPFEPSMLGSARQLLAQHG